MCILDILYAELSVEEHLQLIGKVFIIQKTSLILSIDLSESRGEVPERFV